MCGPGKAKSKDPTPVELIARMRGTEEMVQKKIVHLEKKCEDEVAQAKAQSAKGNKRAAIQALARKRRHEKQLQQLDGILTTLEFQREALESVSVNQEVVSSMQTASKAMKDLSKGANVDDIHKLMDEIQEQREIAEEVTNAITTPATGETDEDELMAELRQLEEADAAEQRQHDEEQIRRMPEPVRDPLPGVTGAKSKRDGKKGEEESLQELQAWLA